MIVKPNANTFQSDLHLPSIPYPSLKNSLSIYLDILHVIVPIHLYLQYKESLEKFVLEDSYLLDFNHRKLKQNDKNWLENVIFMFFHKF